MKIAVLTATRDRLEYTKHCFRTLHENAGCDFDHYVFDQGSQDGTFEWLLLGEGDRALHIHPENVGISRAMNELVAMAEKEEGYDVFVKFDNDCELLTPNTVCDLAELAVEWDAILSPRIYGLRNPPPTISRFDEIDETPMVGGIFMAIPAHVFKTFRYSEDNPVWGGDDVQICQWHRSQGGITGYVRGYDANHYKTTDGQHDDFPAYFERRVLEGGPV